MYLDLSSAAINHTAFFRSAKGLDLNVWGVQSGSMYAAFGVKRSCDRATSVVGTAFTGPSPISIRRMRMLTGVEYLVALIGTSTTGADCNFTASGQSATDWSVTGTMPRCISATGVYDLPRTFKSTANQMPYLFTDELTAGSTRDGNSWRRFYGTAHVQNMNIQTLPSILTTGTTSGYISTLDPITGFPSALGGSIPYFSYPTNASGSPAGGGWGHDWWTSRQSNDASAGPADNCVNNCVSLGMAFVGVSNPFITAARCTMAGP